jgi:hypothetical protein
LTWTVGVVTRSIVRRAGGQRESFGGNFIYDARVRTSLLITLAMAAFVAGQAPAPQTHQFDVEEATIVGIHEAFKAGRLTCRRLVEQYLRRIDAFDRNGPAINAIVAINGDALKLADDLDSRVRQGGFVGPLHCVPVIVKDNFETIG